MEAIFATFDTNGVTRGYYFESVHSNIPDDVIEISETDYIAYVQEYGKHVRNPATGQRVSAPPPPPPTNEQIIASLDASLESYYDTIAQTRRYRDRLTCALRGGYPGPFQQEGLAFGSWMDNCNALAYQVMADVLAGRRPIPTEAQLLADMPVLVWPA